MNKHRHLPFTPNAAAAAIQFALEDDDCEAFLRYWNEGEFEVLRRNWPEAPEAIYVGADPSHPGTKETVEYLVLQSPAAIDIVMERARQINEEGYTTDSDDGNRNDELAAYATFYCMPPAVRDWPASETGYGETWGQAIVPVDWSTPKTGDRRQELVKAGALIQAEIERMDRAALATKDL